MIGSLFEAAGKIVSTIWDKITNTEWFQKGAEVLTKIINGIKSIFTNLAQTASDLVKKITDKITNTEWFKKGSEILTKIIEGKKIWKSENDGQYEINIGAEFLNRPSANTAATMCHEMVHLYCLVNEIQDTCQKGRYHNKTFKAEAEARDLEIGYDRTVGFSHTNPTEAFKKTLEDNGFVLEVPFARVMPEEKAKAEREKPHRYVCPVCGQEVKTTADLSLICGICEVAMERAD